jgi:hypothetical protein
MRVRPSALPPGYGGIGETILAYDALMVSMASLSDRSLLVDANSAAAARLGLFRSEARAPARQGRQQGGEERDGG